MAIPWDDILQYLIIGSGNVASSFLQSRATGKATEAEVAGLEKSAELTAQTAAEALGLQRDIYNMAIQLEWPRHRLESESLGRLAFSMGSELTPESFAAAEEPPQLPAISILELRQVWKAEAPCFLRHWRQRRDRRALLVM